MQSAVGVRAQVLLEEIVLGIKEDPRGYASSLEQLQRALRQLQEDTLAIMRQEGLGAWEGDTSMSG